MDQGLPGLLGKGCTEPVVRDGVLDVRRQQRVVVAGEDVERRRVEAGEKAGLAGAEGIGRPHRYDGRGQPLRDGPQHGVVARAASVDLVDEDEGGDAQPLQGAHQDASLRLDALDGGDDQHGAVEDAEHPLHLGDEVRVAGGVDEVDRHVVEREGDDGGLDRDPALPLQREGIGPGVPGVDAADLVDHARRVQQAFGQAGLTGVDMGEDPEVEQMHEASCPSMRGSFLPGGT